MKVEKAEQDLDAPFVTITLTAREAQILKQLVRFTISDLTTGVCGKLDVPLNANDTFASPLYEHLTNLGI